MWKEGSLKVNGSIFHYWIKFYEKPSKFGIEGGRISKLTLRRNDTVVFNYDRCEDIVPADHDTELAVQILLQSEN